MNLCIGIGEVVSEPEFYFLYNSNKISIAYFNIRLDNNSIIKIVGYDNKADYIYRNLKNKDIIYFQGKLRNKNNLLEIEATYINKNLQ